MMTLLTILLFIFQQPILESDRVDPQQVFLQGNVEYQAGNFEQALTLYSSILSTGVVSAELYLNMGNAAFRLQQFGHARFYYEKAKKIMPFSSDISNNLDLVKSFSIDKITVLPQIELTLSLHNFLLFFKLLWVQILFWLLSIFTIWLTWNHLQISFKHRKRYGYISLLIITLTIQGLYITFIYLDTTTKLAIILPLRIEVKSEPDPQSTTLFTIHTGTQAFIEERFSNWIKIKLENGNMGWVPDDVVGEL